MAGYLRTADYGIRTANSGIKHWFEAYDKLCDHLRNRGMIIQGDERTGEVFDNLGTEELAAAEGLVRMGNDLRELISVYEGGDVKPNLFNQFTMSLDELRATLPKYANPIWRRHSPIDFPRIDAPAVNPEDVLSLITDEMATKNAGDHPTRKQQACSRAETLSSYVMSGCLTRGEATRACTKVLDYLGPEGVDFVLDIAAIGAEQRNRMESRYAVGLSRSLEKRPNNVGNDGLTPYAN